MAEAALCATAHDDLALVSLASRRGRGAALAAALRAASGMVLPLPGKWTAAGDGAVIGTAPDQWLVLQPGDDGTLFARLEEMAGGHGLLIDLSQARVALRVAGTGARDVLARCLPIDLHPRAMQPGGAAATVAAHVPVMIRQLDAVPTYELLVARSFAASLRRVLDLAGLPIA